MSTHEPRRSTEPVYSLCDIVESRYQPNHRYIVLRVLSGGYALRLRGLTGPFPNRSMTLTANMVKLSAHQEVLPL